MQATLPPSILGHHPRHRCRSKHVNSLDLLRERGRCYSRAEAANLWRAFEKPGDDQAWEVGRKTPEIVSNRLDYFRGQDGPKHNTETALSTVLSQFERLH